MNSKSKFRPNPKLKLMDQVRQVLRYHHYAYRTEQTYCEWIVHYLKFYDYKKHPNKMGKTEIEKFLSHLASSRKVAAATHMLENGINIRVLQKLMGHSDVKTTEIYTHVMEKDISLVLSPLDELEPLLNIS